MYKESGIHFLNLPCQTTSWYPQMSCPEPSNPNQCKVQRCTSRERQENELKCNTPSCDGQDICIPVYYTPVDLQSEVNFY